jgi:hypothetical protein
MNTYTLHLPAEARPGDRDALDKAEVVKDGFSWGAFFFTALWFFLNRLWLAGLAVLLVIVAFNFGLNRLGVRPSVAFLAQVLLSILIGLEASSLKRWTYARRGRPAVDVVTASDREEAEIKAFGRWLDRSGAPRPAATPASAVATPAYRGPDSVIGLFPDPEIRR